MARSSPALKVVTCRLDIVFFVFFHLDFVLLDGEEFISALRVNGLGVNKQRSFI